MSTTMKLRAHLQDGVTEVKGLIFHPMENGLRADEHGELYTAPSPIVPHYIETVVVAAAGREVLRADWASSISRNPYFAFRFRGGRSGDPIEVTWTDSAGTTGHGETHIA